MSFSLQWHEYVGLAGVAMVLSAYFALQAGKLGGTSLPFQLLNLFGAAGIALSLVYDFNLSAMAIELAWVAISVYGIARNAKIPRQRSS